MGAMAGAAGGGFLGHKGGHGIIGKLRDLWRGNGLCDWLANVVQAP